MSIDEDKFMKRWQVYAVTLLGVAGGVAGLMMWTNNIGPIGSVLVGVALPFFGALAVGAK